MTRSSSISSCRTFKPTYEVHSAGSGEEALAVLGRAARRSSDHRSEDAGDDRPRSDRRGAQAVRPELQAILLTAYTEPEDLIAAINEGRVYRYVTKPWNTADLIITVKNALEAVALRRERDGLLGRLRAAAQGDGGARRHRGVGGRAAVARAGRRADDARAAADRAVRRGRDAGGAARRRRARAGDHAPALRHARRGRRVALARPRATARSTSTTSSSAARDTAGDRSGHAHRQRLGRARARRASSGPSARAARSARRCTCRSWRRARRAAWSASSTWRRCAGRRLHRGRRAEPRGAGDADGRAPAPAVGAHPRRAAQDGADGGVDGRRAHHDRRRRRGVPHQPGGAAHARRRDRQDAATSPPSISRRSSASIRSTWCARPAARETLREELKVNDRFLHSIVSPVNDTGGAARRRRSWCCATSPSRRRSIIARRSSSASCRTSCARR